MKTQIDITEEELLGILRDFTPESRSSTQEGATRKELQFELGWGEKKTLRYLREGTKAGKILPVYITRKNMHGEDTLVKGYASVEAELATP